MASRKRAEVHAGPIVEDLEEQAARRYGVPCSEMRPSSGLPGGTAHFGRLDAVIHRIAQQVGQRGVELFEDVAVHLGLFARQRQMHRRLASAAEVAHHARIAHDAVRERSHATGQRGVVKLARQRRLAR